MYEGHQGWGFAFPCDADGKVLLDKLPEPARENYHACLAGAVGGTPVVDQGVRAMHQTVHEPAVVRCECGKRVTIHRHSWMGAGECERCHRWYNTAGQELNPPAQWGEETGETFSDLLQEPDW